MVPIVVSPPEAGRTVAAVLRGRLRLSWSAVRRLIQQRRVRIGNAPCVEDAQRVQPGQRIEVLAEDGSSARPKAKVRRKAKPPPPGVPHLVIRHADEHIVVVDKPAGLTTMRHAEEAAEFGPRGRHYLPPTLADLLPAALMRAGYLGRKRVRAVHRIDKETSGLVVFAFTGEAEAHLGRQFRAHTIERRYVAIVRGRPNAGRIESHLVRDRGDGRRGSGAGEGQRAVTHVRVVEPLGAYSLVECRLETGRTHQVRIHLGERGTPLCGERVYDRPLHGAPAPDESGAPRLALHAAQLGFKHPATGMWMEWESELPPDLARLVEQLREAGRA